MIKEISYKETYSIRQQVMWPDKPIDYIKLEEDPIGHHFAYYEQHQVLAVISVFIKDEQAQFRKFACLQSFQGQGIGRKLLNYVIRFLEKRDVKVIFCNARIEKTEFYESFGMSKFGENFQKDNQSYIIMKKTI